MIQMQKSSSNLLLIPGSKFQMGISADLALRLVGQFFSSNADMNPYLFFPQVPSHEVRVASFYLSKYEVTNAEYKKFIDSGGYENKALWPELIRYRELNTDLDGWKRIQLLTDQTELPGPSTWKNGTFTAGKENHPVTGVSWFECMAYSRWKKLRLPTEAEWEFAARGSDSRLFPWGNDIEQAFRWTDQQAGETSPVGSIPMDRSPFGILDLARNASEWVLDSWSNYPNSPLPQVNKKEEIGIVRGGMYISPAYQMLIVSRTPKNKLARDPVLGFRCAADNIG